LQSKIAYKVWTLAGKPSDHHPTHSAMVQAKRNLRSSQRQLAAKYRQDKYGEIMDAARNDQVKCLTK
jgi:hypothetical protein